MALASVFNPSPILGANQKISELTSYTTPSATDILPINDVSNSTTKNITITNLLSVLSATYPINKNGNVFSFLWSATTTANIWSGAQTFTASTTLQSFTAINSTTTNATSTTLNVSGLASTTLFRANSAVVGDETVGKSTITNLTVSSCTGCSSASGVTIYVATSSTNRYFAKTLSLVGGDIVTWSGSGAGNNCGLMTYRISAPNQNSTTTAFSDTSCADDIRGVGPFSFLATTTSTVTFDWQAGNSGNSAMTLFVQSAAYAQVF